MHRRRKLPENGVVIVLGARVVGASKTCPAHLSHAFQYRVDTAASYLKAHPKAVCITTGGQGKDEPQSEERSRKGSADEVRGCAEAHLCGSKLRNDA